MIKRLIKKLKGDKSSPSEKRVLAFLGIADAIPSNAKYLYSHEHSVESPMTPEAEAKRIIDGGDKPTTVVYVHYYEVLEEDVKELAKKGFFQDTNDTKTKNAIKIINSYGNNR